jgi:hypothetical protein
MGERKPAPGRIKNSVLAIPPGLEPLSQLEKILHIPAINVKITSR